MRLRRNQWPSCVVPPQAGYLRMLSFNEFYVSRYRLHFIPTFASRYGRDRKATMVRYDDGDSGLGDEGRSLRRSDVEIANHPEQVKSVAIDDWAAVKAPSIVADRDPNPDAYTTDDMHENVSMLASVMSVFHSIGQ